VRILVVDDNERIRRGVKQILSSDASLRVCGEAVDGGEALRMARDLQPDVVLLDFCMPGLDGSEATRLLRQELPKAKIVIMSQHDPIQLWPRVQEAGAHACVDKSRLSGDLLPTLKSVWEISEPHQTAPPKNRNASSQTTAREPASKQWS
jgi:DNA-binding NarL/FixJ family response regulator